MSASEPNVVRESFALTAAARPPSRSLPLLLLLFVGSGCSALIYEIVWFQLLELVIGSSALSLGILLGIFMGGMCAGSLAFPRIVSAKHHPLRVYAFLELGIGAMGILILLGMPLLGGLYLAWGGSSAFGVILRGLIAGIFLFPPTILMGATLPAISRWVESTPEGVSWLGFFYGGNIGGAVFGSLLTGFVLLRFFDVLAATLVAAALNVAVASVSFSAAASLSYIPVESGATQEDGAAFQSSTEQHRWPVYLAIAFSGMTALAAEVIWTRMLALIFGATVYAFALILAVFLLGLGLGASAGSTLGTRVRRPRLALGLCQILLCAAMTWTAWELAKSLPFWKINPAKAVSPWYRMQFDLLRCVWAVLPPAILWGASFPLALAGAASSKQDPARFVGRVYGANTIGTIIGALATSLWLIAWIGSRHAQQVLIVASALSGLMLLAPAKEARANTADAAPRGKLGFIAALALALCGGWLLVRRVPAVPPELIAFGRRITESGHGQVIYSEEGLTTSVAVSRSQGGVLNYHNAGKIQASSEYPDMRLQRMLGHLTTLLPPNPRRFLVIGLGAGVTAGAVSIEPKLDRETIVEIEPLVPKVTSQYFSPYNFGVVGQPKVQVRIDDGRHFLLTTKETFDGITSDPLDPWVKGTAALYSAEFFEQARRHLNPGGVVTQFVQLYESNEEAVKCEIATFFEVFPRGMVFANTVMGEGYDLVLVGQAEPGPINVDDLEQRLKTPEYAGVAKSLGEIGFYSAADLLSTYVGQAPDLKPWLKDAVINRDRNLRLQYLAGMGLNLFEAGKIYDHMIAFGPHFSPEAFSGSPDLLRYLADAIESGSSR